MHEIETRISLEPKLLQEADRFLADNGHSSLSELIEELLRRFLVRPRQPLGDKRDLELIDRSADRLNRDAEDVLGYQVEL